MKDSKAAKPRTGGRVAACAALAAALAFTAVFAQEGAEQEKETLPSAGAPTEEVDNGEELKLKPYVSRYSKKPHYTSNQKKAITAHIRLKFKEGTQIRYRGGGFKTLSDSPEERKALEEVRKVLARHGIGRVKWWYRGSEEELDADKESQERKFGQELPDFKLLYRIWIAYMEDEEKIECVNALNACEVVEYATFTHDPYPRGLEERTIPYRRWPKPYYTTLREDQDPHGIDLKFVQPSRVRLREGKLVTLSDSEEEQEALSEVLEILKKFSVVKIKRGFSRSEESIEKDQRESGKEMSDFNLWYELYIEHLSKKEKVELANALNACDFVERAEFEVRMELKSGLEGPLIRGFVGSVLAQSGPGDYQNEQFYLFPPSVYPSGIDAEYAWSPTAL